LWDSLSSRRPDKSLATLLLRVALAGRLPLRGPGIHAQKDPGSKAWTAAFGRRGRHQIVNFPKRRG